MGCTSSKNETTVSAPENALKTVSTATTAEKPADVKITEKHSPVVSQQLAEQPVVSTSETTAPPSEASPVPANDGKAVAQAAAAKAEAEAAAAKAEHDRIAVEAEADRLAKEKEAQELEVRRIEEKSKRAAEEEAARVAANSSKAPTAVSEAAVAAAASPAALVSAPSFVVPKAPEGKRGFIHKQGHMVKNWKNRYFVLEDGNITYFESSTPSGEGVGKKGDMSLVNVVLSEEKNNVNLKPTTKGLPDLTLDIKNAADKEAWLTAFNAHIAYYNKK